MTPEQRYLHALANGEGQEQAEAILHQSKLLPWEGPPRVPAAKRERAEKLLKKADVALEAGDLARANQLMNEATRLLDAAEALEHPPRPQDTPNPTVCRTCAMFEKDTCTLVLTQPRPVLPNDTCDTWTPCWRTR